MATTTFDGISEPIPANHEHTFGSNQNSKFPTWLSDRLHSSATKFTTSKSGYFWKIFLIGTVFWLYLVIPMLLIWHHIQSQGGTPAVREGAVLGEGALKMGVVNEKENESSSSFFTEAPVESTPHPWGEYFEQLIDEKLGGFQTKWEECRCPPGVVGPPGAPGEMGLQGSKGDQGDLGMRGEMGLTGQPGLNGVPGHKGDKGQKGDTGSGGPPGPRGSQGQKGDPWFMQG